MADFLFDPDEVARVLNDLPALAALLPQPHSEGRPSSVFTGMQITDRPLYRLLANTHYEHLRDSLRAMDTAAAAERRLVDELCNANLRGQFGSYLQEVMLADHFLSRGLTIRKGERGNGRNPDLEVAADGFDATIEVYSPRSWQWREDWLGDVRDTLKLARWDQIGLRPQRRPARLRCPLDAVAKLRAVAPYGSNNRRVFHAVAPGPRSSSLRVQRLRADQRVELNEVRKLAVKISQSCDEPANSQACR